MSRDIFSSRHEGSSRVIDVGMQTVFLRILEELAERHTEELPDEANVSFIMATYMEKLSLALGKNYMLHCSTCHHFDFLKGHCVHQQVL